MQCICLKYWFYLLAVQHNYIKCLYEIRQMSQRTGRGNLFFQLSKSYLVKQIENQIKMKDRALKYSYKQKEIVQGRQYIEFEKFVISESVKQDLKQQFS